MEPPANDPGVIFFLSIVGLIFLAGIAYAVLLVARWQANRIRYVTPTRVRSYPLSSNDRRFSAVSSAERNSETDETVPSPAEIEREKISFAENFAADHLARLVLAEEVDLSKAIKIGAGKKSGEGYQKWSKLVKAAMERQKEPEFPALAAQQRPSIVEKL